ncbi:transposase [Acanthopleuribacter pedis]|uniref:Transposase n=1 Tax=Acanthopleuribacter pedis TaxID=442870 RepID=A0A8J7QEG9_9BACT|nr:transposase [Acanthopleuribacter pedis]
MAKKKRNYYSGEQKVAILKRHLVNGERISDICDELNINPNMFYRWQKTFFENGAKAFESGAKTKVDTETRRLEELQAKLGQKDSVISELVTELIKAKKNIGEI